MALHPDTIIAFAGLHREELDATAARDHRAATVVAPALPWRPLATRVVGFLALCLGARLTRSSTAPIRPVTRASPGKEVYTMGA